MPQPDAADEDTGGVEWTELLTMDIVGRVPEEAPPSRRGEIRGIDRHALNTAVLEWTPEIDPNERIPRHEIAALALLAGLTIQVPVRDPFTDQIMRDENGEPLTETAPSMESVRRWFGLPGPNDGPRAPRDCVPLKVIGRRKRGFITEERRRRMCTIDQTERPSSDPKYETDKKERRQDFYRALFAACVCSSNPAPDLATGKRYEHTAAEPGAGGIYRENPPVGKKGPRGKWRVYEGDKWFGPTAAAAVKRVRLMTDPDSGLAIDMGADIAACWVRIWIEYAGAKGWGVRFRHIYPSENEVYATESYDVKKDPIGGGFEIEGAQNPPNEQ